jgi:hypothetical protein
MLVGLKDRHGLRCIRTGTKQFPLWSIVEPFAVRLHQTVAAATGYYSFAKTYGSGDAPEVARSEDALAAQFDILVRSLDEPSK